MATVQKVWNTGGGTGIATATATLVGPGSIGRFLAAATAIGRHDSVYAGRCAADWRRPDGYWTCNRPAGHAGQHRMRVDRKPLALMRFS